MSSTLASPHKLPARHLLLALAIVAVWGSNFAIIKIALAHLPPLLFAALRFTFALLPACFSSRARRCRGPTSRLTGC